MQSTSPALHRWIVAAVLFIVMLAMFGGGGRNTAMCPRETPWEWDKHREKTDTLNMYIWCKKYSEPLRCNCNKLLKHLFWIEMHTIVSVQMCGVNVQAEP